MKRILSYIGITLILVIIYFLAWPVDINPQKESVPKWPGLVAAFAQNNFLDIIDIKFKGKCYKCEDVIADSSGIYGGTENGDIVFMSHNLKDSKIITNTGGRPLGMYFDYNGNLVMVDGHKGLISMNKKGELSTLADNYKGTKFGLPDDLIVSNDSIIYFTDATRHGKFVQDVIEHGKNGTLYSFDLKTNEISLLIDSMYFPNSIAISENDSFLLITETTNYDIIKYWIKGDKKGQKSVLIDNLPGFPDGIWKGSNGIFWVALPAVRQPNIDNMMPKPFLRKIIYRLPKFIQPKSERYSFIIGIDEAGKVHYNLQDPQGKFDKITNICEFDGKLYLGSLEEDGIGILPIKNLPYF